MNVKARAVFSGHLLNMKGSVKTNYCSAAFNDHLYLQISLPI